MAGDADLVWMPWYPSDYRRDTGGLSAAEHGAYRQLIDELWICRGSVTDSDSSLWRICHADSEEHWRQTLRPAIERFFQIKDGVWRHKRVDEELAKALQIKEDRRRRTEAARQARWGKPSVTAPDTVSVTDSVTENVTCSVTDTPSPSPSPIPTQPPTQITPPVSPPRGKRAQGSRIADDWEPGPKEIDYARGQGWSDAQIEHEAAKFLNHWLGKAGKDACKQNWLATWRSWVLRAPEFQGTGPPAKGNGHWEKRERQTVHAILDGIEEIIPGAWDDERSRHH